MRLLPATAASPAPLLANKTLPLLLAAVCHFITPRLLYLLPAFLFCCRHNACNTARFLAPRRGARCNIKRSTSPHIMLHFVLRAPARRERKYGVGDGSGALIARHAARMLIAIAA